MKEQVTVYVRGGVVQDVEVPAGVEVVIYDYDVDDVPEAEISKDPEGAPCIVNVWKGKT